MPPLRGFLRKDTISSRADGRTLICPDCGTREALESIGVGAEEQEQILEAIHRSQR